MCPCAVVIVHVRKEHMAQVPLAKDDDMVKTFRPDRANQPFRMAILPWRLGCSWPVANAHGTKPPGENFAIAIADHVLRRPFPAAGLGELSGHPFGARVCKRSMTLLAARVRCFLRRMTRPPTL